MLRFSMKIEIHTQDAKADLSYSIFYSIQNYGILNAFLDALNTQCSTFRYSVNTICKRNDPFLKIKKPTKLVGFCSSSWARTKDPLINSQML